MLFFLMSDVRGVILGFSLGEKSKWETTKNSPQNIKSNWFFISFASENCGRNLMYIETSQTFYYSERDVEPWAKTFTLLHLHQPLMERGKNTTQLYSVNKLFPTAFIPPDRLPFCTPISSSIFSGGMRPHILYTKQKPTNPPSEFSWQGFFVYCKETKDTISLFCICCQFSVHPTFKANLQGRHFWHQSMWVSKPFNQFTSSDKTCFSDTAFDAHHGSGKVDFFLPGHLCHYKNPLGGRILFSFTSG